MHERKVRKKSSSTGGAFKENACPDWRTFGENETTNGLNGLARKNDLADFVRVQSAVLFKRREAVPFQLKRLVDFPAVLY